VRKLVTLAILSMGVLTACGENFADFVGPSLGASQIDIDEMTGLYEGGGLPPSELPSGEAWTQGPTEQAVGFYARGGLMNAEKFPERGIGFVLSNNFNPNVYGTYDLLAVVTVAAARVYYQFPKAAPLRIGTASRKSGGRVAGHDSHQNGLDIDLGYYRLSGRNSPQLGYYFFDSMVRGGAVVGDFDYERNYSLIKNFVDSGRASRIFVHSAIKRGLCQYARKLGENTKTNFYLSVLRSYPGHGDHMHLRITCPQNSPRCRNQTPPSPATDC